jgi:hypothetical protein
MGRLGNQMFQYAALYALCQRTNSIPALNWNRKQPVVPTDPNHKMVIDECFDLTATKESNDISVLINQDTNLRSGLHKLNMFFEGTHHYNPNFERLEPYTEIRGYFQDERYFKDYDTNIRKEFTFKQEIQDKANEIFSKLKHKTVSLHVRRGDYLNIQDYHPCPSINYYNECISKFDDHLFLVFSDDIKWCKTTFIGDNFIIQENDHFVDLCLMSMCDNNIIANSSFSWWGAWLNNNKTKQVYYPSIWFGPKSNLEYRNGNDPQFSMCLSNWNMIGSDK